MQFLKALRPRIADGEITTSIRIWRSARVRPGGRYRMGDGWVVVEDVREIAIEAVTGDMARDSGFAGLVDLLKTARRGSGDRVFLVRFYYDGEAAWPKQSQPASDAAAKTTVTA